MRRIAVLVIMASIACAAQAQKAGSSVDDDGTLHLPNGEVVPFSDLATPEARKNFIDTIRGYDALASKPADWKARPGETAAQQERRWYDEKAYLPWLAKLRQQFAVTIAPKTIAGVQTDVVDPKDGISARNRGRVLINLHGGGMVVGGRYGGQLESIPVASIGRIRVVTVDYRMAPEHKYPAAEDDVAAVYRALLKTYRPENIGIYGCSSGASLTGSTVARLIATGEPHPGAIGMFGFGPFGRRSDGDSNYIFSGGKPVIAKERWTEEGSYTAGVDMDDPRHYPVEVAAIQRRFPPSLLISGTRDLALSRTVYAHSLLVDRGVDAELHVWEGIPHCAFAQPFVDPDVPESRQAWNVIVRFFDKHLGQKRR